MHRVHNFSAGPATLPLPVLEKVQRELLDYRNAGMSVIEMSHRGEHFNEIYTTSIERLRRLASIPDRFDILYMSGGASTQFALVPMNLARRTSSSRGRAGYTNTGVWSKKAIAQARLQGIDVSICGDSESTGFDRIPDQIPEEPGLDYLHITSNNTIYGTQFRSFPEPADTKLVIDMSSDFLSAPIDWTKIGMVYAGAQKNAGPAGLTVVIMDREYYERESKDTPTMFRYSTFGNNESRFNTPPVFQIYVFGLVLEWLESKGGLVLMETHNQDKANLIYNEIDAHPDVYVGPAHRSSRSLMNITFKLTDESRNDEFMAGAIKQGLMGLKGHRSVGGFRASVYNAMGRDGCDALALYMRKFAGGQT